MVQSALRVVPQTLENRISSGGSKMSGMRIIKAVADLRQQIHDDLRRQHPEWVLQNGESPIWEVYEARLMDLLGLNALDATAHRSNAGPRC